MSTQAMRDVEAAFDEMCWREHEYRAYMHQHHNHCDWEHWNCTSENFEGLDTETKRNLLRRLLDAEEVRNNKRNTVRNEWEKARGWRFNPNEGGLGHPVLDLQEIFEDAAGRKMGTVAHIWHASRPKIEEYAARCKLRATFLEDSWYAPGIATAVLLTKGAT